MPEPTTAEPATVEKHTPRPRAERKGIGLCLSRRFSS